MFGINNGCAKKNKKWGCYVCSKGWYISCDVINKGDRVSLEVTWWWWLIIIGMNETMNTMVEWEWGRRGLDGFIII
jgi:hypothetical protein